MFVEWDEQKRLANRREHGIDFVDAMPALLDPSRLERTDARQDYGETRIQVLGKASGRCLFLVYTERTHPPPAVKRIVSARLAEAAERRVYDRGRGRAGWQRVENRGGRR
jgi:uncharacterized protein